VTVVKAHRLLLVDGTGAPPKADVTILVIDGRISEIGHHDSVVIPPRARLPAHGTISPSRSTGRAVRRRIRRGANVIKVGLSKGGVDDMFHPWGDDPLKQIPSYSLEEIEALVSTLMPSVSRQPAC
jgi:hypothetical protein